MPEIGVRMLKARASEILREVEERRVPYTITRRGRVVAVLLPIGPDRSQQPGSEAAWDELAELGQEVAAGWVEPLASYEILSNMRR